MGFITKGISTNAMTRFNLSGCIRTTHSLSVKDETEVATCQNMSRAVLCGCNGSFRRLKTLCAPIPLVHFSRACATAIPTAPTANSSSAAEAHGPGTRFSVDPKQLPNTIPGISQEELAERIEKYEQEQSFRAARASERALVNEIDTMRRAMPPEKFQQFLKEVEEMQAKNAKEAARLDAMSPQQLYQYQQRQRIKLRAREILKTVWILMIIIGSIFFTFFLFIFFH